MDLNEFQSTLKTLGKQAKKEAEQRAQAEAEAKRQQEQENVASFASLIGDVKPLKNTHRYEKPRDLSPIKLRQQDDLLDESSFFYVGDGQSIEVPATFSKNGRGQNDIKRLQTGHYTVVADVDLHGYTQEEAQKVLNEFIEFVKKRGVCGEIVHGSGLGSAGYQPRLKNLVRRWLMMHPDVLAYAEPHKNNDGSVLILLKRQRREEHD